MAARTVVTWFLTFSVSVSQCTVPYFVDVVVAIVVCTASALASRLSVPRGSVFRALRSYAHRVLF